jgi:hypothetical protein
VASATAPEGSAGCDASRPLAGDLCGRLALAGATDAGTAIFFQAVPTTAGSHHLLDSALKTGADD